MKYIIELSKLQFGDIILTRNNDRTCLKIRAIAKSNYSHALVYKGNKSCLESNAFGVQSVNPQRLAFENINDLIVLRLKKLSDQSLLELGLNKASKKVGMEYASRRELMKSYLDTLEQSDENNRQFCTRLVAQVYYESGVSIVENPDYCSPRDIEESILLTKVTDILREGTKEEIEFALDENNVINIQTESTFNFLENIRKLTGEDIQTLDDAQDFLLKNKEYDEQFDKLIKKTQYLNLGDIEKNSNPFLYDTNLFLAEYGYERCYGFAVSEYRNEQNRIYSFQIAINECKAILKSDNLKYIKSHLDCYERQLELCFERLEVFNETIEM